MLTIERHIIELPTDEARVLKGVVLLGMMVLNRESYTSIANALGLLENMSIWTHDNLSKALYSANNLPSMTDEPK